MTDNQISGVNSLYVDPLILDVVQYVQYVRARGEYLGGLPVDLQHIYLPQVWRMENINLGKSETNVRTP